MVQAVEAEHAFECFGARVWRWIKRLDYEVRPSSAIKFSGRLCSEAPRTVSQPSSPILRPYQ